MEIDNYNLFNEILSGNKDSSDGNGGISNNHLAESQKQITPSTACSFCGRDRKSAAIVVNRSGKRICKTCEETLVEKVFEKQAIINKLLDNIRFLFQFSTVEDVTVYTHYKIGQKAQHPILLENVDSTSEGLKNADIPAEGQKNANTTGKGLISAFVDDVSFGYKIDKRGKKDKFYVVAIGEMPEGTVIAGVVSAYLYYYFEQKLGEQDPCVLFAKTAWYTKYYLELMDYEEFALFYDELFSKGENGAIQIKLKDKKLYTDKYLEWKSYFEDNNRLHWNKGWRCMAKRE